MTHGYAPGRSTRTRILDVARTVFVENGFRSSSLRDIAAKAGISHPGLLHHFPTKQDLLIEILRRRDADDAAAVEEDVAGGVDAVEALLGVVRRNTQRPGMVELFAVLSTEAVDPTHPAHEYFTERYRHTIETLRAYFDESRSLRTSITPIDAARTTVAMMDGLQIQWLMDRDDRIDMEATMRRYIRSLTESSL
ncbi:TetR family transcriptional regulator [Rhodococcoides trifolii]|uniref:TetR family transcriptional regulator n=1 Tax=Rhodococcoides trifolii TaxID=908250 RepID=A0A917LHN2_9NOCA|nr:TetR/AcrR family transcriptional regulator [Rhodococcus trifolii]GGG24326.1 TetR family transcriptional regulator [Rhodococcus trifolii]